MEMDDDEEGDLEAEEVKEGEGEKEVEDDR